MSKLFLDDKREPYSDEWDVVRNYGEFVEYIDNNKLPSIVSLDHDLHIEHYKNQKSKSYKHPSGLDCAEYLLNYCVEEGYALPEIWVHSKNPTGSMRISSYIETRSIFHFGEEISVKLVDYNKNF